jgi:hypothetical protein
MYGVLAPSELLRSISSIFECIKLSRSENSLISNNRKQRKGLKVDHNHGPSRRVLLGNFLAGGVAGAHFPFRVFFAMS